ncbi:MAG: SurA N-terminal domain-containing protein, partial [Rhodospirillaceae bacterium]|nr:SurA N-terminal domain-containing protein [Rhodospirillaceae bacterium]
AGIILALIAVAFIFWGVDPTIMGTTFAAKVNGEDISLVEFDRALQNQQSQYQELYRVELTDELQRALRLSVIEDLIQGEALSQRVASEGYRVSDARLAQAIRTMPEFQVSGEFSMDVYRSQLMFSGLSPTAFEEQQREQLGLVDLQGGIGVSAFYTPAEFARYIELFEQEREVAYALFPADAFLDRVEVDEAQVLAHYDANKDRFFSEESVNIEYLEFTRADFTGDIEVNDEILQAFYEQEQFRYQTDEDRRPRHILIGSIEENTEAEARAMDVLARLDAGEAFEDLAAEVSEDPGTSGQGGDLGWLSRGTGAFQDAVFDMELGEVRGPVKSEFGYHIIRLDDIREGEIRTFEAVRDELEVEYRDVRAEELFFDAAQELDALAFDAFDELTSVASEMELPLKTFEGLTRTGTSSPFPVADPVIQTAFSPEVLELGENSRVIEVLGDHVAVLRVTAYNEPREQPLEAVRVEIEAELARTAAEEHAGVAAAEFLTQAASLPAADSSDADAADGADSEDAEAEQTSPDEEVASEQEAEPAAVSEAQGELASLAGELGGSWTEPTWLRRTDTGVPPEILTSVFNSRPDGEGAAVRARVPLANGDEAVVLMTAVRPGSADRLTRDELQARLTALAQATAGFELAGYAQHVRDQASVRIPDEVLDPPLF